MKVKFVLALMALASVTFAHASSELECDLAKTTRPSAQMLKVLKNPTSVIECEMGEYKFEVGFMNVAFARIQDDFSHGGKFVIHCASNNPMQAYYYGGFPIGFETQSYKHEPWFYNPESGRCSLIGNEDLLKGTVAKINQGVMVILLKGQAVE